MGRWRAAALIAVHVLIGLHIAHWLTAGETITPVEPSEAMAFSQASIVNAGLIFFAAMILLTAVFGRLFCGWACHLVALQDLCRWLMLKVGIQPRPLKSRALAWVPALAFLYMFVWPLAYRWYQGDSLAVRATEYTTPHFWATFPGWIIGGLTFLTCGFVAVYFLGSKGFCTYACPYGAIFAAADQLAPMRIRVTDACEGCGHCSAVCSSNVLVHQEVRDFGMVVSSGCMKCGDCVSVCPKDALYFGVGTIPLLAKPRTSSPAVRKKTLGWGEETLLVVVFAVTFLIVRGLYGLVPFLMSLGVAGIVAFFAWTTWRLYRGQDFDRPGFRLQRAGKLLPGGRFFVVFLGLLTLFLAHSAVVRIQIFLADRAFAQTAPWRVGLLAASSPTPEAEAAPRDLVERGIYHWRQVEKWGLFPTLGQASKLAWMEALRGDLDAAAPLARLAITRDELPADMYQLLARAAWRRGDTPAAAISWEAAIESRPDRPEAYLSFGIFLASQGNFAGGQQVFDRGLLANPQSPQLAYNAALARALLGHAEEAIPLFEKALALDPQYRQARENLAGVLASLGRFDASIAHYRMALEQAPNDAETRLLLAKALLGQGSVQLAAQELRNVLQVDAFNLEAQQLLEALARGSVP